MERMCGANEASLDTKKVIASVFMEGTKEQLAFSC